MAASATTIRLDPELKAGLLKLSKLRSVTLNRLVSAALADFVARDAALLQRELAASIADLDRLARADPDFERAIGRAVEAELSGARDPAEGEVRLPGGQPTTDRVRTILGA